jgi:hypothetical protein
LLPAPYKVPVRCSLNQQLIEIMRNKLLVPRLDPDRIEAAN